MKLFKFELEEKLDQHFDIKFDIVSDEPMVTVRKLKNLIKVPYVTLTRLTHIALSFLAGGTLCVLQLIDIICLLVTD